MNANAQVFVHNGTAATARLRGVGRIDRDYQTTSIYRFVVQQLSEQAQTRVMCRQGQVFILEHKLEREIFECNQAIRVDQPGGELVPKILALIGNMFVQLGDYQGRLFTTLTTFLATAQALLGLFEVVKGLPEPTRVINLGPIRQRQQAQQPHIAAHGRQSVRARQGQLLGRRVQLQVHIPACRPALENDVLDLTPARQEAMQLDLELAHVLHFQNVAIDIRFIVQVATVAIRKFQTFQAAQPLESRITRRFSFLHALEESVERLVQPSQGVLQAAGVEQQVAIGVAPIAEVGPLANRTLTLARRLVNILALFQRPVVHLAVLFKQEVEGAAFTLSRVQTVLVSVLHSGPPLRCDVGLDCLFANLADAAHVITAAPQTRQPGAQFGIFPSQHATGVALELVRQTVRRFRWRRANKQMYVIWHDFQCLDRYFQLLGFLIKQAAQIVRHGVYQDLAPILGTPNQVILECVNR